MEPFSVFERRMEILALAEKYGARNVRVFGSVARGEAHPDSDIDFLVELEPGRSLFDLGGLLYDLQSLLGVEVDVVTEKGLRARIRDQVLQEAILSLYESDRERLLDILEAIERIEAYKAEDDQNSAAQCTNSSRDHCPGI
jgi:predicted nucleotidyltransferase